MTMRVGDRVEVFNVYKALRLPAHYEELSMISMMKSDATSLVPYMSPIDPLERALIGDEEDGEDEMMEEIEQVLDMSCCYIHGFGRFEELDRHVTLTPPKLSIEEAPKIELKPLSTHLRYAYLENSETLPLIISSSLTNAQEKKILKVLREHKKAIEWIIANIKGISPSICMHKIFLEDGHRPCVEHQRRLNPIIKEVVKKEVIKWLDAGIIFPISDSNWTVICPKDQEKTIFTCPYGTFSFKCMPFVLCNAPATFQRCMMAIFTDMVEKFVEVFMDDFSVFGSSYDDCLKNLSKVLDGYEETNLVLNWEKFHYGAGRLLEKDVTFNFDDACLKAFEELKKKLVAAPIIAAPDWSLQLELMCDASDHAIGAVLCQRKDMVFYSIYYAKEGGEIKEAIPYEQLFAITQDPSPWYANYVNYLVSGVLHPEIESEARKRFLHDVNFYYWDEPYLYKQCADQLMRRFIPVNEVELDLYDCHASPYGGHRGGDRTAAKIQVLLLVSDANDWTRYSGNFKVPSWMNQVLWAQFGLGSHNQSKSRPQSSLYSTSIQFLEGNPKGGKHNS
ncbi:uncharacterized protein [Nicotiana tomentosiformis]|uniref:uncharacterized protein n=1 Tax=Nicotiana tomentosiformis TaxID=4098 RepID=UPI00388C376C